MPESFYLKPMYCVGIQLSRLNPDMYKLYGYDFVLPWDIIAIGRRCLFHTSDHGYMNASCYKVFQCFTMKCMDVVDIMLLQWAAMDSPVPQFNRGRAQSFLHFRSSLLKVHLLLSLASGGESTYSLQESIFHILK